MRWWLKRCGDEPPIPDVDLAERRAAAIRARKETAAIGRRIEARAPAVADASSRWAELRARNHFGDLITSALRGRES